MKRIRSKGCRPFGMWIRPTEKAWIRKRRVAEVRFRMEQRTKEKYEQLRMEIE